nr:caspase-2-like [Ciona intestinalis]|eukprot:XP_002122917.1 caspase-2-like [Ciona intestinalis]
MKKRHRNTLIKNRVKLAKCLHLDEVLQYLVQCGILTDVTVERITSKPTRFSQNVAFLTCLPTRGPRAYGTFLEALRISSQEHLVDILEKVDISNAIPNNKPITPTTLHATITSNVHGEFVCARRQPMEIGKCEDKNDAKDGHNRLRVQNSTVAFFNETYNSGYKMTTKSRGYALIVCIGRFNAGVRLPDRQGTDADKKNLLAIFEQINYKTILVENCNKFEMERRVKQFAQMEEHRKCDSCAVAILSHGSKTDIYASDGRSIPIESLIKMFDNVNCPPLRNKPKIFFIQCCRGNNMDQGIDATDGPPTLNSETSDSYNSTTHNITTDVDIISTASKRLPTSSDMIIGYATLQGNAALRNTRHGSWYIQVLVKKIAQHAHEMDLLEILTLVNSAIKSKEGHSTDFDSQGVKEMSEFHSTLCKKLFFYPGIVQTEKE